MKTGTSSLPVLWESKQNRTNGRGGHSRLLISRNCSMLPAVMRTRRENPSISCASSKATAAGSYGHAVSALENAHGDREIVVNGVFGGKRIERAADGEQRSMRTGECSQPCFLHLQERFILPVDIFLRSELGLILLQQAVNAAGRADMGIVEALDQDAKRVGGQHAGSVGEGHDVAA